MLACLIVIKCHYLATGMKIPPQLQHTSFFPAAPVQLCSNVLSTALNWADQHMLPQKVTQQPDRLTPGIATCNISTQNIYSRHDEKASLPCFLVARLVKFTFIATISLTDFDFKLYINCHFLKTYVLLIFSRNFNWAFDSWCKFRNKFSVNTPHRWSPDFFQM